MKNFSQVSTADNSSFLDSVKQGSGLICQKEQMDREKISLYSATSSLLEVGLGSTLHNLKVPFKGAFLAILQNLFLILFGKDLQGKGLTWIVCVTTGLKAFSPSANKLRPMMFIFLQGLSFTLPIRLFGWNFISVLMGSLFIQWVTIIFQYGLNYLIYGEPFIKATLNGLLWVSEKLSLPPLTIWEFIFLMLLIKTFIGFVVAITGFYTDLSQFLNRQLLRISVFESQPIDLKKYELPPMRVSLGASLVDLSTKIFLIPFLFCSLLIYFLAHLNFDELLVLIVRGLTISWFGFLLARRIDIVRLIAYCETHNLQHISEGLIRSLGVLEKIKKRKKLAYK